MTAHSGARPAADERLITRLPHPPELLTHSNAQQGRLVRLLRERDTTRAVRLMREHIEGTEHILAGLFR